jgi:hypothetical protein
MKKEISPKESHAKESHNQYHSMYQFLGEHHLPDGKDKEYAHSFYWDLYTKVKDADLPETQRRIRSNLLVKVGLQAGTIQLKSGGFYNGKY